MDDFMQNWVAINAPYGTDFTIPQNRMRALPNKYRKNQIDSLSSVFKCNQSFKSNNFQEKLPTTESISSPKPTEEFKEVLSDENRNEEISDSKSIENETKDSDHNEKKNLKSEKKLSEEVKKMMQKEEVVIGKMPSNSLSLDAMVNLKLDTEPFHQIRLPEIYRELTIFDPDLTGFADESQFTLLAMKYELPLKVSTIRSLCRNFTDEKRPHLVNYFKLLKFLASCLPADNEPSLLRDNKLSITTQDLKAIMESYPVSDKVVSMLKEQLSGSGHWDLQDFYEALLLADQYNDKHLPAETVLNVCMSQRVPLTSSLLIRLLQISEIEVGVVDWRAFLSPIVHACAQSLSSQISWKLSDNELNECLKDSSTSIQKFHSSIAMKQDTKWKRNFTLLSLALKTHNPYETDLIPRDVVERMMSNYNIVYELGYSDHVIENAIDRAVVDERLSGHEAIHLVSIEKLLQILSSYKP